MQRPINIRVNGIYERVDAIVSGNLAIHPTYTSNIEVYDNSWSMTFVDTGMLVLVTKQHQGVRLAMNMMQGIKPSRSMKFFNFYTGMTSTLRFKGITVLFPTLDIEHVLRTAVMKHA